MDWLTTSWAIVLGLFLRLVIPIIATIIMVYLLKRLDERWKRSADDEGVTAVQAENVGCWKYKECPAEQKALCEAYANPGKPCWQVFRAEDGMLRERCLGCDIFKHAPIPASA